MSTRRLLYAIDGDLAGERPAFIVCSSCGRIWDIPRPMPDPIGCPRCYSENLHRFDNELVALDAARYIQGVVATPAVEE